MSLRDRIAKIHDVFPRRQAKKGTQQPIKGLSDNTRLKVLMLYRDVVAGLAPGGPLRGSYLPNDDFWSEVLSVLQYEAPEEWLAASRKRRGRPPYGSEIFEEVTKYLLECPSEGFLKFLELSFKVDHPIEVGHDSSPFIDGINQILQLEGEPYRLMDFVREEEEVPISPNSMSKQTFIRTKIISYPMVIDSTDEVVYEEAIAPSLVVLGRSEFRGANDEFRKSLEHYRAGRYGDFLSNCGSALESVLKVIGQKHKLRFGSDQTLGPLLDTAVAGLGLDKVYAEKFKLLATIRNRLSSSHGGGSQPRNPEHHYARLMLTSAAEAIVFLVAVSDAK